jgi:acetyl-CoA C-acetyltransferase
MTSASGLGSSYIIAARRTALGRPGGLHRSRRLEGLAAPVVLAALEDAGIDPHLVEEIILGNTTAGGNPARLVGLAAGLRERVSALTVDRQCASGLDAILLGMRAVALGDADVVVAGGAESVSTAPWRVAKPKNLFQTPRFIGLEQDGPEQHDASQVAASEELARRMGITRDQQDAYALHSFLKAEAAQSERRFIGEIVPLKMAGPEARDEHAVAPEIEELAALDPLVPPDGTHTSGNTSAVQDGAAMAVIVSGRNYREIGAPPALRLVASATEGVGPADDARAPVAALEKLLKAANGSGRSDLGLVEMAEASAAQALALRHAFALEDGAMNPDGGAVARGYPLGAASAVSVVRLFTRLVRAAVRPGLPLGAVTQGAVGGLGVAALFEAV